MSIRKSLRQVLSEEKPLVTPIAHDALSARLIARAGFKAFAIGGSSMLAARYALPDLGLAALGEMAAGAQDILSATDLPCIVDGDDGYGDGKNIARMMELYQFLGVSGVVLEDQVRENKQPGADRARGVISEIEMEHKIRAAIATRTNQDLTIIARTDSFGTEGLDGAMRRADRYLKVGADGIFIPGIESVEDLALVGKEFREAYQIVVMSEGGKTSWLPPAELYAMGFSQVFYPSYVMLRMAFAIDRALVELREFAESKCPLPRFADYDAARTIFEDAVRLPWWQAFEDRLYPDPASMRPLPRQ